jgi:pyruvate/2-oxoacid:ferredoxin oxidoreductase alpha subunit
MGQKLLMKGNEVIAEAAIRAGCRHYFGYPITPQTELMHYMAKRMPAVGGVFLQAESEVLRSIWCMARQVRGIGYLHLLPAPVLV